MSISPNNTNSKTIILLGPAYPYRGGIAAFNERIAREYQKLGHKVELYTFTLQYPNLLFPGKTQYSEDPAPSDLKVVRALNSMNPINWFLLGKELQKKQADVIISHFWLPFFGPSIGLVNRLARKNKKTKHISIVHNAIPHEKRIGDYSFTKYLMNSCDGFISLSRSVLNDIGKFSENQNKTYEPHPVYDHYGPLISKEEACKKLNLDPKFSYLLFFGLIRKYKGLDLLLEALAQISNPKIKLLVAGEFYDSQTVYQDQIKQLGISDKVRLFPTYIPDEEVGLYFGAADLVVQPYKNATQSGISQMAYHFEKPMIVTNVGGLPEIVPDGEAGYVVEVNPNAIATAINNFYQHPENQEKLEAGVKQLKKRFSWERMANSILNLAQNSQKI